MSHVATRTGAVVATADTCTGAAARESDMAGRPWRCRFFFGGDKRINQGEPTNMVIESVQLLVVASRNGFSGHKLKAPNPGLVKSIPLKERTHDISGDINLGEWFLTE